MKNKRTLKEELAYWAGCINDAKEQNKPEVVNFLNGEIEYLLSLIQRKEAIIGELDNLDQLSLQKIIQEAGIKQEIIEKLSKIKC